MSKILLIIAAALSLGAAVLGFLNKGKLDTTREELTTAQADVEQKAAKITEIDANLGTAKEEREAALTRANDAEKKVEDAQRELAVVSGKVSDLEGQMKAKVTEIEDLNTQLAALKTPESTTPDAGTTAAASATTEAIEALKQQVVAAELEKNLLAEKLDSVQTQMVTLQREAQRREQGVMARGLQGTILAVNPAWNFVVLSLGDRQGVANNAEMIVRRGGRLVGRVRVTSVERTNSIADIVPGSVPTGVTIQPGDVVIFAGAAATES